MLLRKGMCERDPAGSNELIKGEGQGILREGSVWRTQAENGETWTRPYADRRRQQDGKQVVISQERMAVR